MGVDENSTSVFDSSGAMIKTGEEIRRQLNELWPRCTIMIPDKTFWLPTYEDVKKLLWDTYFEKYRYVVEGFDCDDYALIAHAFVVQERYKQMEAHNATKEDWFSWAFGEPWGTKFMGETFGHAPSICVTADKGVTFAEPQSDALWKADPARDDVYFIRM